MVYVPLNRSYIIVACSRQLFLFTSTIFLFSGEFICFIGWSSCIIIKTGNCASASRDISTRIIANSGLTSCMQTFLQYNSDCIELFNVEGRYNFRKKTFAEKRRRHFIPITVVDSRNVIFSTMYLFLFVFSNEKKMSRYIIIRIDV